MPQESTPTNKVVQNMEVMNSFTGLGEAIGTLELTDQNTLRFTTEPNKVVFDLPLASIKRVGFSTLFSQPKLTIHTDQPKYMLSTTQIYSGQFISLLPEMKATIQLLRDCGFTVNLTSQKVMTVFAVTGIVIIVLLFLLVAIVTIAAQ